MVLSLLRQRRSIRRFQDRPVERLKVEQLVEALVRSPSSRGLNPWDFIVVDDREVIRKLARAKEHGSAFLEGAPLAVVFTGHPERCDVWIEDCAIATILLQMTAEELGLGSCWVQVRLRLHRDGRTSEDYLHSLLGLPEGQRVLSVVGVGYPAEEKAGHAADELPWHKVHHNRYGKPWGQGPAAPGKDSGPGK